MEVSMPQLPANPDFDHLKKQAKDLLRQLEANDAEAFEKLRRFLPAAEGKTDAEIAALGLKLHDMQSCIARSYGLPAWKNLRNYVDWSKSKLSTARKDIIPLWVHKAYGHDTEHADPIFAANRLKEIPDFVQGDLFLACAIGDEETVRRAIAADPACVNRINNSWNCPGCKHDLSMPPLFAVTHSTLTRLPDFRDSLRQCARLLLDAGANPNQSWEDKNWGHPVSALYGAAGKNHDATLTKMLLEAGANPNDTESLYHAVEGFNADCLRLLLEAGARVEGSNALHHQLDMENLERLQLMLAHTKDANDTGSALGSPLIWAIRRRRSLSHIEALVNAGADPRAKTKDGISAYVFALQSGLRDVAAFLLRSGASETLSVEDQFVIACAAADRTEAQRLFATHPDMFSRLSDTQLRQLPNLTESRDLDAVRLMVELGWPIAVTGGDWQASALNLAVFQGDPELTRFLLEHGASWTERHGFGDNVNGILGWASRNEPAAYPYYEISGNQRKLAILQRDWVGCAQALVAHGMPLPESLQNYSEAVAAFFRGGKI